MGKTRWKIVSPKKLSARKRGSFKTARILSSGGTLPLPSGLERGHDIADLKVLPCVFSEKVLCSHRKSVKVYIMDRCWECSELARFEREMDEEEEKFFDEVDEVRRRFPV